MVNYMPIKLFPNPTFNENTFIDLFDEKVNDLKLEVYTIHGQLIYTKQ